MLSQLTRIAVALVIAVPLFTLCVPRLIAAMVTLPANPVLTKLQNQETVTASDLEAVIRATRRGLFFTGNGRFATDLGLAKLLVAERTDASNEETSEKLTEAVGALRDGLGSAPGNPYAWARLAYAEARLEGWTPNALAALRLALLTAAHEPRLLWSRLRLSFLAWPHMSDEDREMVLHQVRIAWDEAPQRLTKLSVDLDQENIVRSALSRNLDELDAFDALVRKEQS